MKLAAPETRACSQCGSFFTTKWPQNFCNQCKYSRATRAACAACGKKVGHVRNKICWECRIGPAPLLREMSPNDLAWLAGLIEGEGYLGIIHGRGVVRVAMTDADVVDHLQAVSGVGLVRDLPRRAAHHKPVRSWTVQREASVPGLLLAVTPLLGSRRRIRASEILTLHGIGTPDALALTPGSDLAWSWVGGLIEGEGFFQPSPVGKQRGVQVAVDSTDEDIVQRLANLAGVGTVINLGRRQAHWKPRHRWRAAKKSDVELILSRILPTLGSRRSSQASYVLQQM